MDYLLNQNNTASAFPTLGPSNVRRRGRGRLHVATQKSHTRRATSR